MKVVLATKNPGKLKELKELASDLPDLELVLAPDDFGPEETGATFLENAIIKAQAAAHMTGLHSVADDSGIEVDALDGRPGVHSARYCEGSDTDRRLKLLREVNDLNPANRNARYVCAMAFCSPDGTVMQTCVDQWEGTIGKDERGSNGFGYDPIFFLPHAGRTAAELSSEEKNAVSHRALAWRQIQRFIQKLPDGNSKQ